MARSRSNAVQPQAPEKAAPPPAPPAEAPTTPPPAAPQLSLGWQIALVVWALGLLTLLLMELLGGLLSRLLR